MTMRIDMTMVIDDDCETTTVRVVIASRCPRFSARRGARWSAHSSVCCNRQCAVITQAACRRRSAAAGGGGRTRWDAEECGSLLDVVIRKCKVILKLLAIEDQILLVQKNPALFWICTLTSSIVSDTSTSKVMVVAQSGMRMAT